MAVTACRPASCSDRVEVSGWDAQQMFFVEKCDLEWEEEDGKQIALKHMVRDGAMVFLRLLQPSALERPYPMAYEAEFVGMDADGQY